MSGTDKPVLAVDWGTTNRRVFLIEGDDFRCVERDSRGASVVTDYEAEIAALRQSYASAVRIILSGMVGSTIGWRVAPYVPVPAGLADVAARLVHLDDDISIVPGLCDHAGGGDVMRGEETLILGAIAGGMIPGDALVCQPGTHSKWATVECGRISGFTTAMTGELFSLVTRHSILSQSLTDQRDCGDAFRAGVREGMRRDIAASLFSVRARPLLYGNKEAATARSHISGMLIGAEVAARIERAGNLPIHLVAAGELADRYADAMGEMGASCKVIDADCAFAAGTRALAKGIR